jgi:hypothetical protein
MGGGGYLGIVKKKVLEVCFEERERERERDPSFIGFLPMP